MTDLEEGVSPRQTRPAVYTDSVTTVYANTYLATAMVFTGSGPIYSTSSITVNIGGRAQWSKVIQARTLSRWQKQGIETLKSVLSLPENWDSYGSPPPTKNAEQTAMAILTEIDIEFFIAPCVVPVSRGGIQLEWELGTRRLELEILDDGSAEYLQIDGNEPKGEGPVYTLDEIRPLFLWLTAVAPIQRAA
jgi:hypothetical protein